jgi:hypothetical protein
MNPGNNFRKLPLLFAVALTVPAARVPVVYAQAAPAAGVPVRVIVTVTGKEREEPPKMNKEDFLVFQGKQRRPVLSAVPQTGPDNKLNLIVLVDEANESQLGTRYSDVSGFLRELPSSALVGLAYARNGSVTVAQDLTADREAVIKGLRLPIGRTGATGGIFLSILSVAKGVQSTPDRRTAILLLSSGIDTFRGVRATIPSQNPDLDRAVNEAQRKGITIYSIYVAPGSHFQTSFFLSTNGQACLSALADETGGEAYFSGTITPISMQPFLEEMQRHLAHQYSVTFAAVPQKKAGLYSIKVRTEVSGAEVDAPAQVLIPAAQAKQ